MCADSLGYFVTESGIVSKEKSVVAAAEVSKRRAITPARWRAHYCADPVRR